MTRLKRISLSWAKEKKSVRYIAVPRGSHKLENSIALITFIRDYLKLADTAKEAKRIIKSGDVFVDGKVERDQNTGLGLFTTLEIEKAGIYKRFTHPTLPTEDIQKNDTKKKVCKIIGKKVLKGGKLQYNLHDGRNIISEKGNSVNDSLLIELPSQKVLEVLKFDVGANVFVTKGTNLGSIGRVKKVQRGLFNRLWIEVGKKEMEIPFDGFIVVGKNIGGTSG
ncbi:MAG: 30S ribosomal protein S4e [Candidatus Aenigmarchaeota archaeon]|nr:30S ribosomal protein S4e [Candidatus Aenigmarchaeota archaeon]